MQLWQALLIGIFAYLGRNQVPWFAGTSGGFYMTGRPLVAGLICGLILGDVRLGVLCGIAVQALFIGQIVPGGALPSDLNLAAYVGIPLAIAIGGNADVAVSLAVPLGALGVALHNLTMTFNAVWAHRADKYAAEGNAKQVRTSNLLGTVIHLIERVGIVTLTCYLGVDFAKSLLGAMPPVILTFLAVGGKMLPALGFAVLLKQIVSETWMILLFVFGWVIMVAIPMTTTALVMIAITIGVLFVMAKDNQQAKMVDMKAGGDYEE